MAEDNPRIPVEAEAAPAPAPADAAPEGAEPDSADNKGRRRLLLTIVAIVVVAVAAAVLLYHLLIGVRHVSTDNAYVGADTAQVTPLIAGAVASVRVANTQFVHRGDILVVIDPADANVAAARASAELAQARRELQQTRSTGGALDAQVAARDSDIARARAEGSAARADFDKAGTDLARRERLAGAGAVSGEELTSARSALANARARLGVADAALDQAVANRAAARAQLAANRALTAGPSEDNPDVQAARARYDAARLDVARAVIRAPIDGIVAQRNVQVGQRVAPGVPVMTIVPVASMFVDANFKESQLGKVRVGQPVTLTSDLYGGDIVYHGRVVGFAGGTGAAFALIPAQNATGNWIKVVQRVPVRIALDARELADHPLRVGLSMDADVDVSAR